MPDVHAILDHADRSLLTRVLQRRRLRLAGEGIPDAGTFASWVRTMIRREGAELGEVLEPADEQTPAPPAEPRPRGRARRRMGQR